MITQIEIDGFKTFKDFKVELAPFQVIVGPNGSGKSNLFDALQLLSRLAENDLRTAFQPTYQNPQKQRGDANDLFTALPNGEHVDCIRMAVELLVDRKVKDDLGQEAELQYTRLRYEIAISPGTDEYGLPRFFVRHESLKSIPLDQGSWCQRYGLSSQNGWLPENRRKDKTFIDTGFTHISALETGHNSSSQTPLINLYPDRRPNARTRQFSAQGLQRTLLSSDLGGSNIYIHVFAARQEMRSWNFLHLNHEALRQPNPVTAPPFLSIDGSNLPTMLARLQTEDSFAFHSVSRDMANLVPGILEIKVEKNPRNEYDIWAKTSDQLTFSAQVLSDGTLRLLALAALRNDPQFHGLLCLEEPENGVDPLHLKNMARLLREMATDFTDPEQVNEPLKQILITTHSPAFISLPEVMDSLLLAVMATRAGEKSSTSSRVTKLFPVVTPNIQTQIATDANGDRAAEAYTIDMVRKYLDSASLDQARNQLKQARTALSER